MTKAPADQVYWKDITNDAELQRADSSSRGIWMANCLPQMWFNTPPGTLSGTLEQLERRLNCSHEDFVTFMSQIKEYKFGDVVTDNSEIVTLINRRVYNKYLKTEGARLRKQKSRAGPTNVTTHTPTPSYSDPPPSNVTVTKKVETAEIYMARVDAYYDDLREVDKTAWYVAYKNANVDAELLLAREWLKGHLGKRREDLKAFTVNWLKTAQKDALAELQSSTREKVGATSTFLDIARGGKG